MSEKTSEPFPGGTSASRYASSKSARYSASVNSAYSSASASAASRALSKEPTRQRVIRSSWAVLPSSMSGQRGGRGRRRAEDRAAERGLNGRPDPPHSRDD